MNIREEVLRDVVSGLIEWLKLFKNDLEQNGEIFNTDERRIKEMDMTIEWAEKRLKDAK